MMKSELIHPWEGYIKPFRIYGNVYFVGTRPASSHLIDTGDGLILLDSGYPQTLYLVMDSIRRLGFDPMDIRIILHSHGHYDHLGATRALAELTGAQTVISEADAPLANGSVDLTWAKELGADYYEAFEPDRLLRDGDVVELGSVSIKCLSAPGHTEGTMAFFFDVTENGKALRPGMHGGVGVNSLGRAFLDRYGLSYDCRERFLQGLDRLRREHVDITLGNHVHNNDTEGKGLLLEELRAAGSDENPFVDASFWPRFLDRCERNLRRMLEKEAAEEAAR